MNIFAILGYIVILLFICIRLNGWNSFFYLFDFPSFVITILFLLLTLWGTKTIKDFLNGIKIGLGHKKSYSMLELKKAEETLHLTMKSLLIFGCTFCLISFLSILLYSTSLSQVGPMVVTGFRSLLYPLIVSLFLSPFKGKIHMLLIAYAENDISKKEVLNEELLEQKVFFLFRSKGLTDREAEIARLISQELTNREIAGKLYISEATVKKHITHILEKLGLEGRDAIIELIQQETK